MYHAAGCHALAPFSLPFSHLAVGTGASFMDKGLKGLSHEIFYVFADLKTRSIHFAL